MDLDRPNVNITITDPIATALGTIEFMQNRSNNSAWATTNSTDAAGTQILIEMFDLLDVTDIMLIKHNFKDYIIEFLNPVSLLFEEYASETSFVKDTVIHEKLIPIQTRTIRITINSTKDINDDKSLRQLIIAEKFFSGELESYPKIRKPKHSKNRKVNKLQSGKVNVVESRGAFSTTLEVKLNEENDLEIFEAIYENREGVLMLLSGGEEEQFITRRLGYRNEDIVLVRPVDEYINEHDVYIYQNRIKLKIKLNEAVF